MQGFSGNRQALSPAALVAFLELALRFVDHTIRANRTAKGLFHSYNLLVLGPERTPAVTNTLIWLG